MAVKSWTFEENALLDAYAKGVLSVDEVAKRTGRTVIAIRGRAHKAGITKKVWNRNLPVAQRNEVVRLYSNGLTMTEIQNRIGLSYHQIRWCLDNENVVSDHHPRTSGMVRNKIVRLFNESIPLNEIAEQVGRSRLTVMMVLRALGFDTGRNKNANIGKKSKGRKMPRREKKILSGDQVVQAVSLYNQGYSTLALARVLHCSQRLVRDVLEISGFDVKRIAVERAIVSRKCARLEGKGTLPAHGYGKRIPYETPFQGRVVLRSATEAFRAKELDAAGTAWFYEVRAYPVGLKTYTPDFWVSAVSFMEARKSLGVSPDRTQILSFLENTKHVIEDVKGWWKPEHPSFNKIQKFRALYPEIPFGILLLDPSKGVRKWL